MQAREVWENTREASEVWKGRVMAKAILAVTVVQVVEAGAPEAGMRKPVDGVP